MVSVSLTADGCLRIFLSSGYKLLKNVMILFEEWQFSNVSNVFCVSQNKSFISFAPWSMCFTEKREQKQEENSL